MPRATHLAPFLLPLLPLPLLAQHEIPEDPADAKDKKPPMYVAPASNEGRDTMRGFQLADRLVCELVAAEPDLCNGVAFAFDGKGRCYVAETNRIKDGVFDNREYMAWKDADLACLTVADRLDVYRKYIPSRLPRFDAYSEQVRMLVDTDRNGTFDRSTVFAGGFHDLADGIGSGVLPVGDDVWFTNIPKLWKLRDRDGDGVADERTVVHDGFGVHSSLIGHDLHGLIVGPDRRLYFSIGDRGLHVQQGDRTLAYPHEGAVLRCELDGSDLEVVHRGLRNPQELAFDAQGDLFTGDNNSDGGDRARLVQIVPGADSGWRIGFQWLDDRGAWNREKMWHPRHPGQGTNHLPPIANFADGPSGFVFDPGTGLPERFRGCFFLCDFRGGAAISGVHAIRFVRQGAGYELASADKVIWNVLPTDVDFGPDGSMYVLDWVAGWDKTGKGRIYRVRTPEMANDFLLRSTAQLLASDLKQRDPTALQALLAHADRRVRQAAQFALVDLGARDALLAAADNKDSRLARLHAIYGLGILGRKDAAMLDGVAKLLDDGDADVRAAAARVLGDARIADAEASLRKRLTDGSARVQREAALALARLGNRAEKSTKALVELLRSNDDRDAVLRHAAAHALGAAATADSLHAAAKDASAAVRLGAVLAMQQRADAAVAELLQDPVLAVREAAARAIYETPIPDAMQALALLAYDEVPDSEPIDWRALNANRMLGTSENGEAVVHFATLRQNGERMRKEALAIVAEWKAPHGQCRVIGNWRPCQHPGADIVSQNFRGMLPDLLADPVTAAAAARAAAALGLHETAGQLTALVAQAAAPSEARVAALDALADLDAPELAAALDAIDAKADVALRQRAVALLSKQAPEKAVPVLATLLDNAPQGERQAALEALGNTAHASATAVLRSWVERLAKDDVPSTLQLDLLEAAGKHEALRPAIAAYEKAAAERGPLGEWRVARDGGNSGRGRSIFHDNEATRCTRCHSLGGSGGNAGPALDGIGKKLTRDQLLEALVTPSARIAEGFGAVTIELNDGNVHVGVITKDQDGAVTLVGASGEPTVLPSASIKSRKANAESAMPKMAGPLSRRQLRDVVEFLSKQQR